jgi:hypothetical protein
LERVQLELSIAPDHRHFAEREEPDGASFPLILLRFANLPPSRGRIFEGVFLDWMRSLIDYLGYGNTRNLRNALLSGTEWEKL